MINLLPPEQKSAYRYARHNLTLLRWIIAFTLAIAGLCAISTAGLIYIKQAARDYNIQISSAQTSLQQQNLTAVQAQVRDISGNLKLAVQVLSKEVLFSKLLQQLSAVMPNNSVLSDLTISQTQSSVNITADTTDYTAATQLQVNLTDPNNKIFSRADIISIVCTSNAAPGSVQARYPCAVTIRALFATNNPFLFINDGKRP